VRQKHEGLNSLSRYLQLQETKLPPELMSRNTLDNIASNKERVDYCVDTFS
jgi:hypothetical protein